MSKKNIVPKDAQCCETYEKKQFSNFYFVRYGRFCAKKFLKTEPQYPHKWPKFDEKISFAPILLVTRSKCVPEDSKKIKKSFTKMKLAQKMIHYFL